MEARAETVAFIKQWEALRLKAYLDSGGVPTIGIGTIRYPNGDQVRIGDTITEDQAYEYLFHDLRPAVETVNQRVSVPLTPEQFDALVSFVYNVGDPQFAGSTLLRKLNEGDYRGAANEFLRWNRDNGRIVPGLTHRRSDEQDLFLSGGDPTSKGKAADEFPNSTDMPAVPYDGDKDQAKKL